MTEWLDDAACRDADPSLFDPPRRGERDHDVQERVFYVRNRYCLRCPVIDQCKALQRQGQYPGVWAGKLYGDEKAPADEGCGTDEGYRRHRMEGETPCSRCRAGREAAVQAEANRRSTKVRRLALPECGTWDARRLHAVRHESCATCSMLDETRILRYMGGELKARLMGSTPDPELNTAILRLREAGLTNGQIGQLVGLTRDAVQLRARRERMRRRAADLQIGKSA